MRPELRDSRPEAAQRPADWIASPALPFSPGALRASWIALWKRVLRISRRPQKRLRLCETLPLGERRFVAVVEFEKARFLVGGTATSLVLLSRLGEEVQGKEDLCPEQPGGNVR